MFNDIMDDNDTEEVETLPPFKFREDELKAIKQNTDDMKSMPKQWKKVIKAMVDDLRDCIHGDKKRPRNMDDPHWDKDILNEGGDKEEEKDDEKK
jgi:hypothetical protein